MRQHAINWVEGGHLELIRDIRGNGLDPQKPENWRWDPRPTRASARGQRLQIAGNSPAPCPFLEREQALFEAHAEWRQADGKIFRLLVSPGLTGILRWAWQEAAGTTPDQPSEQA
jgi:ribosome modulation factor